MIKQTSWVAFKRGQPAIYWIRGPRDEPERSF